MLMRTALAAGLIGLCLLGYLAFAPIPAQPQAWPTQPRPERAGPFASNGKLAGIQTIPLPGDAGPEHIVTRDGWIYAGLQSGAVVRLRVDAPNNTPPDLLFNTGGRPLGMDFDTVGNLYIADAMHGLLRAHADSNGTWSVEPLTNPVEGPGPNDPIRYADAALAGPDGVIYFTDASTRFAPKDWGGTFGASLHDALEHSCSGRVLAYDPGLRYTRVVMRDLCFPNGLALSRDGRQLLVSETGSYRIWKLNPGVHALSAKQALAQPSNDARVIIDNLPGYPDNLMRGLDGRVWCGLIKPRTAITDWADRHAWVRALALRLPQTLWPVPKPYGQVFAFNDEGEILINLDDPQGRYPETTAATEAGTRLYIHSLTAGTLGWLDKKAAGL